jgi:AraC-like DNA-binding protein
MTTLRQHIINIAKEKGFNSLTDFINHWIQSGRKFDEIAPWLQLEYGIVFNTKNYAWRLLRDYLTIPYSVEDQFWYKWDAIAKVKGFQNARHMIQMFRNRKLCLTEIAEELGMSSNHASQIIRHILHGRQVTTDTSKRKYHHHHRWLGGKPGPKTKDRDGISNSHTREHWRKMLDEFGFRSLRDAVDKLRRHQKLNYTEMAQLFGVTARDFRLRRQRAKLI